MATHSFPAHRSRQSRRVFLSDVGMGFTGLVLGNMLERDGIVRAASPGTGGLPDGQPHFPPKAKNVIWIFLIGGLSHLESLDPKPALNQYAGQLIEDTPHKAVLEAPFLKENLRIFIRAADVETRTKLYPLQVGFRKYGQSGLEMSDWFPHLGNCADEIAIVRSMWTTDNNHSAQLQFHTGRHVLEGQFPTIGSWVHYGLGSLNDNLPSFIVLGQPISDCCGGVGAHGANYLGPEHAGVQIGFERNCLPFNTPGPDVFREEQESEFALLGRLNQLAAVEYPDDAALRARIRAYELAFRMQTAVPEVVDCNRETEETRRLYGIDQTETAGFGRQCLVARRMVEKGVRFVQIFHGAGGGGAWDAHSELKNSHSRLCREVDRPLGALIQDLKRTGLLDETLVVIGSEFGRTPGSQNSDGRDHNPFGFSVVMAGGGIQGGLAHGRTDELGFHAIEDRHYVTDIHATVLHQLGLDSHRLEIPGRKRLEIDHGQPIRAILKA